MQILIWGDYMKRQISICIFLSIIVIFLAFLYIKFNNETGRGKREPISFESTTETEDNEPFVSSGNNYVTYYFYAVEEDGRISIYDVKSQTLYMETGIEVDVLPLEIQQKLESKIFFETEGELFDFLESYSS